MDFPNMLPNQGTNTGVTTRPTNYNVNGDKDISEAFRCITSSDLSQNQTSDNYSPPKIELLGDAINDLQELDNSKSCQEIVLNPLKYLLNLTFVITHAKRESDSPSNPLQDSVDMYKYEWIPQMFIIFKKRTVKETWRKRRPAKTFLKMQIYQFLNNQADTNKNQKWVSLRAMKTFIRKFRLIKSHQWPFNDPATNARGNIL